MFPFLDETSSFWPYHRNALSDVAAQHVLLLAADGVISPADQSLLLDILGRFKASEAVYTFQLMASAITQVFGELQLAKAMMMPWSTERSPGMHALKMAEEAQMADEIAEANALDLSIEDRPREFWVEYAEIDPAVAVRLDRKEGESLGECLLREMPRIGNLIKGAYAHQERFHREVGDPHIREPRRSTLGNDKPW